MALGVCLLVVDPPRPAGPGLHRTARSPYRESVLWRIHLGSALLVIPQFAVASFTLVYLVSQRHWDPVDAGRLIFVFQLVGAGGRVVTGVWSDRVHSRLRPMRRLAVASTVLMTLLAAAAASGAWWIVPVFGTAAVVTVADNGLAYTAVAETAGVAWSGRALGVHNTGQNVASLLTAPLLAAVIGDHRYAFGFALVAIFPLLAIPLTPVRRERHSSDWVAATADQSERIGDRLPFGKARTP
jgi:MFS family permease